MRNFKFFILSQDVVTGPYLAQGFDPKEHLSLDPEAQFWVQGFDSWRALTGFADFMSKMVEKETNPTTVGWFLRLGKRENGPMNRWELESFLGRLPDLSDVFLRTEERKSWQSVYDFPHIIDNLGVSRRKVPRAAMMGHIIFKQGPNPIIGKARTISENGLGVLCTSDQVHIGETYHIVIDTPHFDQPLSVQGEVLYRLSNGELGIIFHALSGEAKAKIITYVKRYSEILRQKLATAA